MSFADFTAAIAKGSPPPGGQAVLAALWHDARGEWSVAHEYAQAAGGADGAWVHAYLHRKEGDRDNAAYWYARAGREVPAAAVTLAAEWEAIARELLRERRAGG